MQLLHVFSCIGWGSLFCYMMFLQRYRIGKQFIIKYVQYKRLWTQLFYKDPCPPIDFIQYSGKDIVPLFPHVRDIEFSYNDELLTTSIQKEQLNKHIETWIHNLNGVFIKDCKHVLHFNMYKHMVAMYKKSHSHHPFPNEIKINLNTELMTLLGATSPVSHVDGVVLLHADMYQTIQHYHDA